MNPDPNQPQDQPQEPAQAPTEFPVPEAPQELKTPEPQADTSASVEPGAPVAPDTAPLSDASTETPAPAPYAAPPVIEPTPMQTPEPVAAPVDQTAAPNPFGGTPVSSDASAPSPFGAPAPLDTAAPTQQFGGAIGSTPNNTPMPPVMGKPKKKVALIAAIVGGIIVLLGAAFAAYMLFFTVSRADYQAAYDQMKVVREVYNSSNVSTGSSADALDTIQDKYENFKTESKKLDGLKAFRADKDLKVKYDAYHVKFKAYTDFGDTYIPSVVKFSKATQDLTDLTESTKTFSVEQVQGTIDIYKGVSDVSDPTLKTYIASLIAAYTEILPQAKIYSSSSSSSSEKLAAATAISKIYTKISDANKTFSTDLKAKTEAVSMKDEFDELGKAVTAKLNGTN